MSTSKIPNHLGLIIDGNRRWAKKKGLPSFYGHKKGFDNLIDILNYSFEKGVKIITVYAFSTENWSRSKREVSYLMKLLKTGLENKITEHFNKKGIKLKIVGQKEKLSNDLQKLIEWAENLTKDNKRGVLNLAISYGGKAEIIAAVKKIIDKKIPSQKITEKTIEDNLWITDSLDFIIRTGGQKRLSNFLTWQSTYSELYFTDKTWPDFKYKDLDEAFKDYDNRQRKFGK